MTDSNKSIVLVGLMGSGKSRIGIELARILQLPFADVDREIEYASNHTVAEIFERFGEDEFRRGEKKVITRLLADTPQVIATGGGAFIQPEIKEMIKQKAISVWLKADLETLVKRTSRTSHRPLLKDSDPEERLRELIERRYPLYADADITVVTDEQSPQEMAKTIKTELDKLAPNKVK